jgi:hypothetical protein
MSEDAEIIMISRLLVTAVIPAAACEPLESVLALEMALTSAVVAKFGSCSGCSCLKRCCSPSCRCLLLLRLRLTTSRAAIAAATQAPTTLDTTAARRLPVPPLLLLRLVLLVPLLSTRGLTGAGTSVGIVGTLLWSTAAKLSGAAVFGLAGTAAGGLAGPAVAVTFGTCSTSTGSQPTLPNRCLSASSVCHCSSMQAGLLVTLYNKCLD